MDYQRNRPYMSEEELVVTEQDLVENPELAEAGVEVGTVGEEVSAEEVEALTAEESPAELAEEAPAEEAAPEAEPA